MKICRERGDPEQWVNNQGSGLGNFHVKNKEDARQEGGKELKKKIWTDGSKKPRSFGGSHSLKGT